MQTPRVVTQAVVAREVPSAGDHTGPRDTLSVSFCLGSRNGCGFVTALRGLFGIAIASVGCGRRALRKGLATYASNETPALNFWMKGT